MLRNGTKSPNFLIVGAAKSGTTSLCHYLSAHPEVFIPKEKELFFFSMQNKLNIRGPGSIFVKSFFVDHFEEYIDKYFKGASGHIAVGEGSTDSLYYYNSSIRNIKKHLGENVNIIIMLRDPVEACLSRYRHSLMRGWENKQLELAVKSWEERKKENWLWDFDYFGAFMYYEKVNAFLSNFTNTKIFLFDDLLTRRNDVLKECFTLLKVSPTLTSDEKNIRFLKSGIPRNRLMLSLLDNQNVIKKLFTDNIPFRFYRKLINMKENLRNLMIKEFDVKISSSFQEKMVSKFSKDVKKLEKLIGRSLSHWKSYGQIISTGK